MRRRQRLKPFVVTLQPSSPIIQLAPTYAPPSPLFCLQIDYNVEAQLKSADARRLGLGSFMTEYGAHSDSTIGIEGIEGVEGAIDAVLGSYNYWMVRWMALDPFRVALRLV